MKRARDCGSAGLFSSRECPTNPRSIPSNARHKPALLEDITIVRPRRTSGKLQTVNKKPCADHRSTSTLYPRQANNTKSPE